MPVSASPKRLPSSRGSATLPRSGVMSCIILASLLFTFTKKLAELLAGLTIVLGGVPAWTLGQHISPRAPKPCRSLPKRLMQGIDTAMCFAKEDGKNAFRFFTPNGKTPSVDRLRLESYLRQEARRTLPGPAPINHAAGAGCSTRTLVTAGFEPLSRPIWTSISCARWSARRTSEA